MRYLLGRALPLAAIIFFTGCKIAHSHEGGGVITDLPAGAYFHPENGQTFIDFSLVETVPADRAFLRVCAAMSGNCSVAVLPGENPPLIGYTCQDTVRNCWLSFVESLRSVGGVIIVSPRAGGASFSLSFPSAPATENEGEGTQ